MRLRKRFGQHFLEPAWVRKVVDAIAPGPDGSMLEIGPGGGALTLALAPRVSRLMAVEIDRDLADALEPRLPPHVTLVRGDFLKMDLAALCATMPRPVRVVGNLPYNISSPILFRLLAAHDEGRLIADATLMLQREVAERLAASPGGAEYGVLALQAALTADVTLRLALPPGAFRPPPKVESAVVHLAFRPPAEPVDAARFERIVRGAFTQRRKTILNALRHATGLDAARVAAVLARAGVAPDRRPQTLTLHELVTLVAGMPDHP